MVETMQGTREEGQKKKGRRKLSERRCISLPGTTTESPGKITSQNGLIISSSRESRERGGGGGREKYKESEMERKKDTGQLGEKRQRHRENVKENPSPKILMKEN